MERILCEEREKTRRYLGKSQAYQNMRDAGVRNTRALIELYLFSGETDYVLNIQLYSQSLSRFHLLIWVIKCISSLQRQTYKSGCLTTVDGATMISVYRPNLLHSSQRKGGNTRPAQANPT